MPDSAAKKLATAREPLTWRGAVACSALYGLMVVPVCLMRKWPIGQSFDNALVVALVCLAIWRVEIWISGGPFFGRLGFMFLGFTTGIPVIKDPPPFWFRLGVGLLVLVPFLASITWLMTRKRAKVLLNRSPMHDSATDGP
jgi:hypothetical protein